MATAVHPKDGLEIVSLVDRAAWRAWLAEHHGGSRGVWLRLTKKGTSGATAESLTYHDALLEALNVRERVTLVELPVEERGAILREFPRLVPAGIFYFRRLYDLPNDRAALPHAFAGLATRATVFRIEHSEPAG